MSDNLMLEAKRQVFTKSGRECTQTETVEIWQTPSSVTHRIIALPTFTEQLDAYCAWADETENRRKELAPPCGAGSWEEMWDWEAVYDSEVGLKGKYFELDNEYWPDRSQEQYVVKVVLKGEPDFESIDSQMHPVFKFAYEEEGHVGVGYRLVKNLPHSQVTRNRVNKLTAEEYEMSFSWI